MEKKYIVLIILAAIIALPIILGASGVFSGKVVSGSVQSLSCIDSDNGINYSVKGSVTYAYIYKNKTMTAKYLDTCYSDNKRIIEVYCSNNAISSKSIKCDSGVCKDGACIPGTTIACYNKTDCPEKIWGTFCSGNSICTNKTNYTCINPGTAQANCKYDSRIISCSNCSVGQTCMGGSCVSQTGNTTMGFYCNKLYNLIKEHYNSKCGSSNYLYTADIKGQNNNTPDCSVDFWDLMAHSANSENESWCIAQLNKNQTYTPTCVDSDGGKVYNIKGTASGITSSGTNYSSTDYCRTDSVTIVEMSCSGTSLYTEDINCKTLSNYTSCSNGFCH